MANLSIKSKLLTILLAVSLFSIGIVASLNYYSSYQTLKSAIFSNLTAVRVSRANQIQQFVDRLSVETKVATNTLAVRLGAREFIDAYRQLDNVEVGAEQDLALRQYYEQSFLPALEEGAGRGAELNSVLPKRPIERYLQYQYIANNPFPVGQKGELTRADDGSAYSRVHEKWHPSLKRLSETLGFAGVKIIDIETGAIVYSKNKSADFATRLTDGPYAHTNLADLFRRIQRAPDPSAVEFADFELYRPSLGTPMAFVGAPIFEDGREIAVLVFQFPTAQFESIMTGDHHWEAEGLGRTGETYLVGADHLMRSNSRFLIQAPDLYVEQLKRVGVPQAQIDAIIQHKSSILRQEVTSAPADEALRGKTGTGATLGYRGAMILASWAPLNIDTLHWGIVAKIDQDEAFEPMSHLARDTLIQTLVILLIITMVVMFLATSFVRPVNDLIARVQLARSGKTDMTFATDSTDEIGDLARSFRELIGGVQKQTRLLEQATNENQTLLENVMPKGLAHRVRIGQGEITERIDDVSVVFAELKGLAEYTQATSDNESVSALKHLISAFDEAARRHGVERIKTVGDTYLAATGISQPLLDHMRRTAEFAKDARKMVADFNREKGSHLGLTVGIGSGPVVADVWGQGQSLFQIWGAAVIAADHAMDCGGVDDIVVTRTVRDGLADQYEFKPLETSTSDVPLWTLAERS